MITTDNVEEINKRGQGYLMGLRRRRSEDVYQYIERATGEWIECPRPKDGPKTWVQEVESGKPGVRVFVARSEEREAYERGMRERSMERTRQALEKLAKRVKTGRIKASDKIGEAAGRILSNNHGHRYYGWELFKGEFRFFEHPVHLKRERALEGKYLIQTEEKQFTQVEAVQTYKQLTDVERGFREIKDVIDLRPVYHRSKQRVEAHIFVAALAFLIDRAIEKKLKSADIPLSASRALEVLKTIHVVDIDVLGKPKRGTTAGTPQAQQVLSALGIAHTDPAKLFGAHKPLPSDNRPCSVQ
jgi:transposase